MKRLLLAATVAAALVPVLGATPASAAGDCDEKIEIGCNETPCAPDWPCTITPCLVYYSGKCLT